MITMKYLGIDFGTKNIGLAVSDALGKIAFPDDVLKNDTQALQLLINKIQDKKITTVVFGESLDNNGEENKIMKPMQAFAEKLTEETGIEIFFESERYTTAQAKRQGSEGFYRGNIASLKKKQGQKETNHHDASTAALILQGFLDKNGRI